ncbi:hypothetical protein A1O1_01496 [Capronia coronata CBS 617.96]|uniref:Uncharacterized protein n=1 Tax=Capronia coronata CBS 617.96 TaxID=1182541 RepID=W9Z355_9EURO|nr:uncharacterized protein A1O1_01496 [Capronia coronata CBS 617.96]EXJ96370.1 hypothetical protein A1O1_01496 [Capronia coronata CBS 617.96]
MKSLLIRLATPLRPTKLPFALQSTVLSASRLRCLSTTRPLRQAPSQPQQERPVNFYRTHGRALLKALTLAFLTYQIAYWAWLTLETEEIKDQKNREIKSLENEVRLLDESRRAQKSSG